MSVSIEKNETNAIARLEDRLEKLFDLRGEIHPVESGDFWETFHGPGFTLTFPSTQGIGVFVIADPERTLPQWYRNPGIAGRSRLFLLASQLGTFFSDGPCETSAEFFSSLDYFAGGIAELTLLREKLDFNAENVRAFRIHRDDGRAHSAWVLGPVASSETLHQLADTDELPRPGSKTLKPLRSLEKSDSPILYAPVAELEELFEDKISSPVPLRKEIHELAQITLFHTKPRFREPRRKGGMPLRKRPEMARKPGPVSQEIITDTVPRIALPEAAQSVVDTFQPADLLEENRFTTVVAEPNPQLEELVQKVCEDYDFNAIDAEKVLKLPVVLSVLAGRSRMAVRKLLDLKPGDVLDLGRPADAPLEILVEQHCIGTGNAVEYEDRVGIQIDAS
ncbi:MAG: FliM/FliN family flagellar motor switch protein [Planctomycetia bacterium]|nr:FliM/FliN family flagellar motor switch protein [Planctomycetia bacterium]